MEFGLSEEQRILQESVRRLFEEQSPLDKVRDIAAAGTGFDSGLWQSCADLGMIGAIIPEQYGGSGMNFFDAFVILESAGRCTAPAPLLGSMIMAPIALLALGSDEQKSHYLPRVSSGACKFGIAVTEVINRHEDAGLKLAGTQLNGKALFVIDAGLADMFLVAVDSDTLVMAERNAAGVNVKYLPTVDKSRCVAELIFDNVEVKILGEVGSATQTINRMLDGGRIALAADSLGAADVMIEKAVAYAKERQQFNRPIGTFQAVKHMCADMVADLEPARSLIWYAAHAFDQNLDETTLTACQAKSHISVVASKIAKTAIEVHGGMGFTDLLGLHYWFKRIGFNRQLLGGPEQLRHQSAIIQGWIAA